MSLSDSDPFYRDPDTGWVRLDRLANGRIMCCLCFNYFEFGQLHPIEGAREDVCWGCWWDEQLMTRPLLQERV